MIQATKNDVGFLQLVDSGLQPPYCALEMARFLIFKSTMEIVHVSPATVFHVRLGRSPSKAMKQTTKASKADP
jgi:hypothetical protein